jgi:hypothetical protein
MLLGCILNDAVSANSFSRPRLNGTFLQYQNFMMQKNCGDWVYELQAAKKIGLTTVVIQWHQFETSRFFPVNAPGNDPTECLLKAADTSGIEVYLGLYFHSDWWKSWDDPIFLDGQSRRCVEMAEDLESRYGHHSAFKGWYIPHETSDADFDERQLKRLNQFFRNTVGALKNVRDLPVGVSVFFKGTMPPSYVETIYTRLWRHVGFDWVAVQDGVGENNWNNEIPTKVLPYFEAFHKAATINNIDLWSSTEIFTSETSSNGSKLRVPTDIETLKEQVFNEASYAEKMISFDYFHYMSPLIGERQKSLYDSYLSEYNREKKKAPKRPRLPKRP